MAAVRAARPATKARAWMLDPGVLLEFSGGGLLFILLVPAVPAPGIGGDRPDDAPGARPRQTPGRGPYPGPSPACSGIRGGRIGRSMDASRTPLPFFLRSRRDLGLALLALAFFLMGCFIVHAEARTARVQCRRADAGLACDVTEEVLGLIPVKRRHFGGVERASVGWAGDASDPSYRVELDTAEQGTSPLSSMTASERQCTGFARRLDRAIRGGEEQFELLQLPDWVGMVVLPVPFAFFAVVVRFGWSGRAGARSSDRLVRGR
jgi:hypothetical protein